MTLLDQRHTNSSTAQGLRIAPPEAPVNGYMFGKGVYLADISTKSANYCMSYSSGGHGLLLLVEAELGRPMYELTTADCNAADGAKNNGAVATLGVGGTVPQDWVDAGCIHESLKGVMMVSFSSFSSCFPTFSGANLIISPTRVRVKDHKGIISRQGSCTMSTSLMMWRS